MNYADRRFLEAQKRCSSTAIATGQIDQVLEFSRRDLPLDFEARNRDLLCESKGAGYWIWKPQVILSALALIQSSDTLVYADSGQYFIGSVRPVLPMFERLGQDMLFFEATYPLYGVSTKRVLVHHCKRAVLEFYNIDPNSQLAQHPMATGNFHIYRKSPATCDFLEAWRDDMTSNRRMVDDSLSDEHSDFHVTKHDMNVMNALIALRGHRVLPLAEKQRILRRYRGADRDA